MLVQSPDGQVPLDCPGPCHKANRRDGCTSEQENIHVPLGFRSRFAQEEYPSQEECGRDEHAEIPFGSHGCLAKSRLSYLVRSFAFVNNSNLTILWCYDTDFHIRWWLKEQRRGSSRVARTINTKAAQGAPLSWLEGGPWGSSSFLPIPKTYDCILRTFLSSGHLLQGLIEKRRLRAYH